MTFPELPLEGIAVADAVAKATVVLVAATFVSFALRRSSAALRHLVWTLALCSAIALPIFSIALPKWQLPILRLEAHPPALAAPAAPLDDDRAASTRMAPSRTGGMKNDAVAATTATIARASVTPPSWIRTITWPQAVIGLWLIGAALVFARVLIGLVAVQWLSRRTEDVSDAPWLPMARDMASRLGITPRLRFLRSGRASMPVATGVFRPAVIMPADADTWRESRLRIVLLHELAHVKRRDCLTHLLAQTACALHWFNPLAWVAARRARTERERACDDLVLAAGTRRSEYADQLLEIARAMRGDRFPALIAGASLAMAHQSQLEGRLIAILDPKVPRLTRVRARLATVVCFCAVAPLGALQPWSVTPAAEIAPATPAADVELTAPVPAVRQPRPAAPVETPIAPAPVPAVAPAAVAPPVPPDVVGPVVAVAAETALGSIAGHEVAEAIASAVAGSFQNPGATPNPKPSPDPKPSPGAATGGKQPDPRMVAALTAALKDTDKEVRETAMNALVQMRHPSIYEPLVQALKDASAEVREQAAFGLGQLRDRRAVQPLIGSLKDENAEVREQAAFALGQLRDASAVEALGAILRDVSAGVREQVVFALGQIRDRRAVAPLISALKDETPDIREQAAFALGQIRDRGAVEALVIAIKDANADVREQVAFALGQLRDERAIEALTIALKDQSADVRQQAAFALGQLAR